MTDIQIIYTPRLNCTRRMVQLDDFDIAIEALKTVKVEYPTELIVPTRAAFLAHVAKQQELLGKAAPGSNTSG
jgi:hypothetical protein